MDGSETGWGRPAEPAPRWRALLDRARLHGRPTEQGENGHVADDPPPAVDDPSTLPTRVGRSAVPADPDRPPLPRRTVGGGYAGRAVPAGFSGGGQLPEPGPAPRPDPPAAGESRYALLENGYRHAPEPPAESRYALLENGYRAEPAHPAPAAPPAEPAYRREPSPPRSAAGNGYPVRPVPAVESGYPRTAPAVESGYPARPAVEGGQSPRPVPAVESGPTPRALDSGYPARTAPAVEYAYPVRPALPAPAPPAPVNTATPVVGGYPTRGQWQRPAPVSETERAVGVLRRDFGTPRVIAFANPKGGVHKTTATVLAAATVGSVRGRGVLAWDDNELRGTLGLRAGSARHARTIRHLITDLADVETRHGADLHDRLDDYLRHASDGSYDVLAGEESPRFAQRLDQFTVRRVLDLLRRTHDVICVDTGNNVESPNWRSVMQSADQLVLTTVPREDAAFSGDWMLDLLHEVGMGELADNAVTLISCPTPGRSPLQTDLERHFATRTRAVAVVPYDPALEAGSSIEYHQLQQETRDAWLRAVAVMLEPFAR
ncbi:MinD/ParA family ATP-binding protein [Micromonospora echinofusca]|uniref:ATPase n=1 Tax=Micromonospora echinofusca TaxID=47858 RepID=A0ABS3VNF9_MICEH|nr:AAA family ATPase [Micromonospora echinofusca]MBO4206032.1 ATPase [Micromonospora echinofusca]